MRGGWPEQCPRRPGAMAGGEVSPVSSVRGATVHGKRIRRHREDVEEQGITARPKRWPEGKAEAAVAMARGQELPGRTRNGHTSHQTPKEKVGEREGSMGVSQRGKSGSESARGRRVTADGGRWPLVFSVRRLRPPR